MSYSDLVLRKIITRPVKCVPHKSYGIILYNLETQKWLMIQRKHTVEFLCIIKGRYPLSCIPEKLGRLTNRELNCIRDIINGGRDRYMKIILETYHKVKNIESTWTHFSYSISLISKCILMIENSNRELPYLWAKGNRNYNSDETDFGCAMRELEEESGITKLPDDMLVIDRITQYDNEKSQTFTTDCWICVIQAEIAIHMMETQYDDGMVILQLYRDKFGDSSVCG